MGVTYDLDVDESGLVDGLDSAIKALSEVVAKLKDVDKATESSGKQAKKSGMDWKAAAGVATGATAGLVAALGGAVASYTAAADKVAGASKELDYFHTRTGLSTETLAGLQLAAQRTGRELEDLVPEDLATRIVEATAGAGTGSEVFERLGVKVRDAAGNARDADSIFRDYTDALANASDQTIAAGLADDMFSDAGTRLLDVLRDGTATLDMYKEAAKEFGTDTGPEAMRASAAWAGATNALTLALNDTTRQIVGPTMEAVAGFINNFALGFVYLKDVALNTFSQIDDQIVRVGKVLTGQISISEFFTESIEAQKNAWSDAHDRAFKFFTFTKASLEETANLSKDTAVKITIEDERQTKAQEDAAKRLAKTRADAEKDAAEQIRKARTIAFDERLAQLDKEAEAVEEAGKAASEKMEKDTADFVKSMEQRQEAVHDLLSTVADSASEVAGAIQQSLEQSLSGIQDQKASIKASLKEIREAKKKGIDIEASMNENALKADLAIIKAKERETIRGIRAAFFADKAAALSSIVINTAVAVMQAFAQTGIGGPIAAAGITLAGGVQAGIVAAEKPPVHSGGGLGADEGMFAGRLVREGEQAFIVNQRGAEKLDRVNRDTPATGTSAGVRLVLVDAGRVIGEALTLEMERPGSPFSAAGSTGAVDPYRRNR